MLVVDYPPEECEDFAALLQARGHRPDLPARADLDRRSASRDVGRVASGYVYYVSLKGVTGAGHLDTAAVAAMMPRIKAHVKLPVGVGFGIRDATTARAVAEVADAVVIGSRPGPAARRREPRDKSATGGGDFIAEHPRRARRLKS